MRSTHALNSPRTLASADIAELRRLWPRVEIAAGTPPRAARSASIQADGGYLRRVETPGFVLRLDANNPARLRYAVSIARLATVATVLFARRRDAGIADHNLAAAAISSGVRVILRKRALPARALSCA